MLSNILNYNKYIIIIIIKNMFLPVFWHIVLVFW